MKTIYKEELLPSHYTEVGEPTYTGKGNHSVAQLEEIVEGYKANKRVCGFKGIPFLRSE